MHHSPLPPLRGGGGGSILKEACWVSGPQLYPGDPYLLPGPKLHWGPYSPAPQPPLTGSVTPPQVCLSPSSWPGPLGSCTTTTRSKSHPSFLCPRGPLHPRLRLSAQLCLIPLKGLQPCPLPCQGHRFFIHNEKVLGAGLTPRLLAVSEVGLDRRIQTTLSVLGSDNRQDHIGVLHCLWSQTVWGLSCGSITR